MTIFSAIDLSQLPAPDLIEALDYEVILAAMKVELIEKDPTLADVLELESDPITKLLEECAYRELLLRQRVNEAIRALLLARSTGTDLDNLGANRSLERLPDESDERFRDRVQQAFWLVSTAGPAAHYREMTLAVDASIVDVSVTSLAPGSVTLAVLAPQEVPTDEATTEERDRGHKLFPEIEPAADKSVIIARNDSPIIQQVRDQLESDDVQPFTDMVEVRSPSVLPFVIHARLTLYPGPDASVVVASSLAALNDHLLSIRQIGYDTTAAGVMDAIVVTGVQNVDLEWQGDVVCGPLDLAVCAGVDLTVEDQRDV